MIQYSISLISAVILGFSLGLERELTNKQAGLRTHIFVCLGSCVFTLLSIYGFPTFALGDNVIIDQATGVRDTARLAAQIVTGIGFIGAGTVMKNGSSVHGLTTAATLWIAAGIGMACGAGKYDIAIISTILSVLVLICIKWIERNILSKRKIKNKRLRLSLRCEKCNVNDIQNYIIKEFPNLNEIKNVDLDTENEAKIVAVVNVKDNNPVQYLYKEVENINGVKTISIRESDE
ncbi:MgtC/SapB family protein [bacterium]|nr:MgtC/SapB family protein [bacterium]